jgi:hypothetical protein
LESLTTTDSTAGDFTSTQAPFPVDREDFRHAGVLPSLIAISAPVCAADGGGT